MIRVPSPDILEYADTYHLDTVVIIWKAIDAEEAERSREDVASKPELLQEVDSINLINRMAMYREQFYRSLSTFDTFGKGWLRRNDETRKQALEMV